MFPAYCGWTESLYLRVRHHSPQRRGSIISAKYISLYLVLCLGILGDGKFPSVSERWFVTSLTVLERVFNIELSFYFSNKVIFYKDFAFSVPYLNDFQKSS